MKKLLLTLFLLAILPGCAFTVHDVKVNYKYDKPATTSLSSVALNMGEFKDSRNIENTRMIMNQKNGYGQTTTGGWQAEKPLVEIVKDGITEGLIKSGAITDASNINMILSGQLLGFDGDVKMGAWSGSYTGKVTMKLQLTENGTGKIIWRDTFVGSGEAEGGEGIESIVKVSIDNLVDNLLKDEYFIQQVTKK